MNTILPIEYECPDCNEPSEFRSSISDEHNAYFVCNYCNYVTEFYAEDGEIYSRIWV